jgi:acyl-[acyl-carrier-protein] desaturase
VGSASEAHVIDPHIEVVRGMEPLVGELLGLLRPVEGCWQPSELLPQTNGEEWREQVAELREESAGLSDEMLVVLVGNVVTEEALPAYMTAFNRFRGGADRTGTESHGWARWIRAWTAEEKRHGDVTRGYLYLCGRVDLRAVEDTVQHLLRNGFDSAGYGDPYLGLAYGAFQEHATKTCWNQLGRLVGTAGAARLHKICGLVAADEARHERIYVGLLKAVVAQDADGALRALDQTIGHSIIMPARTMTDGRDRNLFNHFAEVGQRVGVYTLRDYAENLQQLIDAIGLPTLSGISGEGAEIRDRLCALPARFQGLADERESRATSRPVSFRWIHGRSA